MKDVTIADRYGDPLTVSVFCGDIFLYATEDDEQVTLALDRKRVKRLRKALKRALREVEL